MQKNKYLENKKSFNMKQKAVFIETDKLNFLKTFNSKKKKKQKKQQKKTI